MDSATRFQTAVQTVTRFLTRKGAAARPPRLMNPVRYPFGEFEFQLYVPAGQTIELQTTRDFKHWEVLDTVTTSKESSVISDKKAGNYQALFYRAVSGPLSSNILGFVSFDIPPGYSMISNPLHSVTPQISSLLPSMPDETTINKFNLVTFSLNKNVFQKKAWSHPNETLVPGDGALIFNPSEAAMVARFVGEVPREEQSGHIQMGTSIRASQLPLAGRLDTDLSFPIGPGDVVSLYSNHNEKYLEFRYTEKGWNGDPPFVRLGEAFWVAKNSTAIWKQKLPVSSTSGGEAS